MSALGKSHTTSLKSSHYHLHVGESVTLTCAFDDFSVNTVMFYWYKQVLGQQPKLLSTLYRHNETPGHFDDGLNKTSRFSLDTKNAENNLKITHLQISDSATYFCVGSDLYSFKFGEGITVNVKGSGLNIPALVRQSVSEIIQPGGSLTLNCTLHRGSCDGEHSVYWFKNSEETPGLIYTQGGSSDQCERKPNTQTHTCDYNLPMKNLNLSHAGTYYCAVSSCGHILFGDGTKLKLKSAMRLRIQK
ncbi:immunoglobulin kappa light chain-like [Eleginops maclovinus]|uniref:immunoglobulin kappa light chain-like n=1 Tax=Eleginops maclovinus TaxID=56733 RepID=UPI0030801081